MGPSRLRQLAPPVAIAAPEAGAKLIAKAQLARGKADYDRTALTQLMASDNVRLASPEEAEKAKQRTQERARRKPNPLQLKWSYPLKNLIITAVYSPII